MTSLKYGCPFFVRVEAACVERSSEERRVVRDSARDPSARCYGSAELARAYGQKRQEVERFCFPVTFIWVQGDAGFSFCISQVYPCVSRGTVI